MAKSSLSNKQIQDRNNVEKKKVRLINAELKPKFIENEEKWHLSDQEDNEADELVSLSDSEGSQEEGECDQKSAEKHNKPRLKAETQQEGRLSPSKKSKTDSKESHAASKALRRERQAQKPLYDIRENTKQIWEKVRPKNVKKEDREILMNRLMNLIEGKVLELALKHDTSRILQTCLKRGNKQQIDAICNELKGQYVELSKYTHGQFFVAKILQYWQRRGEVIQEFKGQITKLMRHKVASSVIEEAWHYAKATDRMSMMQEFYGPEFALFELGQSLDDIIRANPFKKETVLKNLSQTIQAVLDKGTVRHSIIHRALLDYFTYANDREINDMLNVVAEYLVEILHTFDGARVAMLCLTYANAKERKTIIKSLKSFVVKICCEEHGHLVLLRAFDVIDDTTLINKVIFKEITNNVSKENPLKAISENKFGYRVLMYLLIGRSPIFLNKHTRDLLASGDEIRLKTSKKDPQVRARELLEIISPELVQYATGHTEEMLANPFASKLLCEIMLHATTGDKLPILQHISTQAKEPPSETHIMLTFANHTLKVLVNGTHLQPKTKEQPDFIKDKNQQIPLVVNQAEASSLAEFHFPRMLFTSIKKHLVEYATGITSSFPVLALLESKETKRDVRELLITHVETLKKYQHFTGVQLILNELGVEVVKSSGEQISEKVIGKRKFEETKEPVESSGMEGKKGQRKLKKRTK